MTQATTDACLSIVEEQEHVAQQLLAGAIWAPADTVAETLGRLDAKDVPNIALWEIATCILAHAKEQSSTNEPGANIDPTAINLHVANLPGYHGHGSTVRRYWLNIVAPGNGYAASDKHQLVKMVAQLQRLRLRRATYIHGERLMETAVNGTLRDVACVVGDGRYLETLTRRAGDECGS